MDKVDLLLYVNLRNDYDVKQKLGVERIITLPERNLIKQVREYALKDKKFNTFINDIEKMTPDERVQAANEYIKNMEKDAEQSLEEQTAEQEIANTFNVDVSQIQHKFLNNGNEIFSFYDISLNREVILQNNKNGKSLTEQLKEIQQQNEIYQTNDDEKNANDILHEIQKTDIELKMVTLNEIKNHQSQIESMKKDDYNKLNYLINNYNALHIKYINLDNLIYVDQYNTIKEVIYDKINDRYYTDEPKEANYQEENQNIVETNNVNYEIDNQQLEKDYTISEEKNIEYESFDELDEETKKKTIIFFENPFLLDNLDDEVEKEQWKHYVNLYEQKLNQEKVVQFDKPKVKVKENKSNRKAGYISALFLFMLTAFTGGIIASILTLILSK